MTDYSGINSTVSVGRLLRHLNARCVEEARPNNETEMLRYADLSSTVELALKDFYERHPATELQREKVLGKTKDLLNL